MNRQEMIDYIEGNIALMGATHQWTDKELKDFYTGVKSLRGDLSYILTKSRREAFSQGLIPVTSVPHERSGE